MRMRILAAMAAAFAASAVSAQAPDVRESRAARSYDVSLGIEHRAADATPFDGGTVVRTEATTGFSFTFDYHFSPHWSAGITASTLRADYVADIVVAGPLGGPGQRIASKLDWASVMGHGKRHFGEFERVAPYLSGGLGFVSIDTNIPDGPPVGVCWWHPWWGYVCDSVQPTRSSTEFATALGAGVRIDVSRRLFLDVGVTRQWIDFDTADRPGFSALRLAVGIR